jgi:hypothetical protein
MVSEIDSCRPGKLRLCYRSMVGLPKPFLSWSVLVNDNLRLQTSNYFP